MSKYNFLFQAVDAIAEMSPAEFDEATARLELEYEARLAAGERDGGVVFGTVAWERRRRGASLAPQLFSEYYDWRCLDNATEIARRSAGYDFNLEPVTLVETARAAVGWCAGQLLWRRCRRCLTWRRGSYCGGCGGFGHVVPDGRGRRRVAVSLAVAAAGIAAAGVAAVAAGVAAAGAAGAAAATAAVVAALSLERARVAYVGDLSADCLSDEQAAEYARLIREVDEAPAGVEAPASSPACDAKGALLAAVASASAIVVFALTLIFAVTAYQHYEGMRRSVWCRPAPLVGCDPSPDPFMSEFAKNVSLFTSTGELE